MPGRFAQAVHDGKPHLILTHPFSQDEIHAFAVKGAQVMEKRSGVSFKGGPSIMDDKIAALGEMVHRRLQGNDTGPKTMGVRP